MLNDSKTKEVTSLEQLGGLLKERRKSLGMSQTDLAKFTNLSHTGIGRIELARNDVKFETLLKLSKMLGFRIKIELED
ncbi:MAG: helix-turn-helix transcriptional regulator [Bdellovibrionaceae bacterium]|nr:helix-turn-helix transcriptional regulator [Pseudobdellovibrionaceae bacterium]